MEGNSLDLPGSEFSMHWKYSTVISRCPQTELYFDRGVLSSMMRGPLQTGLYISLVGHHLENEEEWGRLSCLRTVSW